MAAALSRLLGRTVTYRELTFKESMDTMLHAGVPGQLAELNVHAFSLTAGGDAEWVTPDVPSRRTVIRPVHHRLRGPVLLEMAPDTMTPQCGQA